MFVQLKGIVTGAALAVVLACMSFNASGQIAGSQPSTQPSNPAASADAVDVVAMQLLSLDAERIADLVNSIYRAERGEPRPGDPANGIGHLHSAHTETQTNTLVLVGDEKALSTMRGLVSRLDGGVEAHTEIIVRHLSTHRAASAAKLLNQIFNSEPATTQQAFAAARARAEGRGFRAFADGERNMVFIVADSAVVKHADDLLQTLEANDGPGDPPYTEVYRLHNAKAGPAAALLTALFRIENLPQISEPEVGSEYHSWFFNAVAHEPTNSVVIVGSVDAVHKATDILDDLDRASSPATQPAATQPANN